MINESNNMNAANNAKDAIKVDDNSVEVNLIELIIVMNLFNLLMKFYKYILKGILIR